MEILEQAVKEVSETGELSFSTRRKLWLALGPWEEGDEMDSGPRALTESLKKRAELALACAKKVAKVWVAYDPDDKGPQTLVKQGNAYLSGKLTAEKLYQVWKASDYMNKTEDERYSCVPMAAVAAERAAIVPYYDEFLLEPRYADADNTDLDPYDWDTAWCASIAWSGQDEEASPGQKRVEEMKFWAWYLEQAAKLLEMENWKFPKKAIITFAEKQDPPKPVPEEVSLESLSDFMGQGKYRYHFRIQNRFGDGTIFGDEDYGYDIYTICRKPEGVCPKCKTRVTKAEFWYTVNELETMLPKSEVSIRVLYTLPMFHCPNHPDISFTPKAEQVNDKATLKRYLEGPGRVQALLNQLEDRKVDVFQIGEGYWALNGCLEHHHTLIIPAGIQGIRWLDQETEELEIDLKRFGPHVYFPNLTFHEFLEAYPNQVEVLEDGCVQITMERHWVRCWLDKTGVLERLVIQSRFHLEVSKEQPIPLIRFLMMEFHLSKAQAETEVEMSPRRMEKPPYRSDGPFRNLTRTEALRLRSALRDKGIKCRVMPVPVGESADTQLR